MGRPLNPEFIGNPASAVFGKVIVLSDAWLPGNAAASASKSVWLVKQINKHRFIATDGTTTGEIYLQDGPVTAAGQARIAVSPFGGSTEYANQINNRTVKTFEDHVYSWNINTAAAVTGQADLTYNI